MNSDSVIGLLSWWDGVELWLSGRGFILQTIIVMPVVLTLAYAVAVAGDKILFVLLSVMSRFGWSDPVQRHPVEAAVAASVVPADPS
ncbi:hypothetical protein FZI91_11860 [Mycobacterium sp. CBMA271]|uniref:hypothetical protein n=1 Tax=unclassified Mycobacteroides TaxID=2618759 RepID=UPI001327F7B0|nr:MULTISPECIES: hypothetical protein [unclassified Mycobacteroides]MUM16109.1 hypothetical protein [Mycobacteroides sp. CBMA 326]MUM22390.1 hypothetical protein [Mycobacteroides sp. CBMA 271]